jgi:diadenylate cyclase
VARSNDFGILKKVAPGTPLRDAISLIVQQESGALVVLGTDPLMESLISGGFRLADADFSSQRLAELAKMDGAILLDATGDQILAANVQLNPDTNIETHETGMRQRTAERVARQTGRPVIAVSEGRETATVYVGDHRYNLQTTTMLLAQANQSMLTLERFRRQLAESEADLTRSEVAGTTLVRDLVWLFQRAALVLHLGVELDRYAVEMGAEGQLLRLQIGDLVWGVDQLLELVYRDYTGSRAKSPKALATLRSLGLGDLDDLASVASAVDIGPMDASVRPRGLRALAGMPRLPEALSSALLSEFDGLEAMLRADVSDFEAIDGIGRSRARQLRRYFDGMLAMSHHLIEED